VSIDQLTIVDIIANNAEDLIGYDYRNKNTSIERILEWFRKIFSLISELMFAFVKALKN
jgi:hypothetical protein